MTSTSPPPTLQEAEKAFADGRFKDARTILQLASKKGDPNAAYALAVAQAYGQGADVDRAAAIKSLQAVAPALPAARRFLRVAMASGWKKGLGWSDAVADLIEGARNGSASDLREVGFLLLINGEANLAISALVEAAKAQDPAAAMALIRLGSADPSTTEITRKTLNRLAQTNHPLAGELTSVYSGEVRAPNCDPIDWTVVAKAVSEPIFNAAQSAELIPTISAKSHQAILSPAICDYVITSGLRALQPSTIVDPETGERSLDPHRKSLSATFAPHMQDLVIHAVERRMTALANMPWLQAERLVMLFYRPGEEYKPHVDYFSPDEMGGSVELTRGGQRVATSLVCLHPAASGGATLFPRFDTSWLGETGDGLTFRNIDDAGQPAPLSLHQGTVVTDGWKALLSLWIRDQNTSPS